MDAAIGSQKQYMAIYMCNVPALPALMKKVKAGFKAAGKKLNIGKSCIRFKKLEDLPLQVIGAAVRATPMKKYVAEYRKLHG